MLNEGVDLAVPSKFHNCAVDTSNGAVMTIPVEVTARFLPVVPTLSKRDPVLVYFLVGPLLLAHHMFPSVSSLPCHVSAALVNEYVASAKKAPQTRVGLLVGFFEGFLVGLLVGFLEGFLVGF